jgi:hypothetical protein
MRQNAIELPALTVLPIPFLELLDGAAPAGATVEPAVNSVLFRDRLVQRALEIRRAVSSGSLDNLDPLSARYLWLVDTSRERCAAVRAQNEWQNAVRKISDDTAAYLNPAELEAIWNKIRSSPCYREVTAEHRAWAELLAAIAQRNAPEIVKLGTELLGPDRSNSESDLAYLTTVSAAALIRAGEIAQARSLLQTQWPRFDHAGQFDLALRELLALTRSAGTEPIAQAVP